MSFFYFLVCIIVNIFDGINLDEWLNVSTTIQMTYMLATLVATTGQLAILINKFDQLITLSVDPLFVGLRTAGE